MLSYQVYVLNKMFYESMETFSNATETGGIDDTNAINTLAQLAEKLMAGGNTVPGNMTIKGDLAASGSLTASGRNILAELNDLKANAVRKDAQYYIDIGVRANGDGCCGNGKGLIIHGGNDSNAAGWPDKNVTTRFSFRQV